MRRKSPRAGDRGPNAGASKRMFDQTIGIHPAPPRNSSRMREKFVRPEKLAAE